MSDHSPENNSETVERLLAQFSELAQLSGSLAHEIKNPLSVIRMNMELLAEDFAEAETPRERRALQKVRTVHNQCIRLQNLLDDFLRFARVRRLAMMPGSLNAQIEQVLEFFELQAEEQQVQIVKFLDPDLPTVMLDEETLQAALVNLVKNALEAMPHGGQLTARTHTTTTGVALDLIDTGCGMDAATAMHMFEAFYTTKDGGSGLGLPTARKIIEAHAAQIDVQSEAGRGTKFTLEFPTPPRLEK